MGSTPHNSTSAGEAANPRSRAPALHAEDAEDAGRSLSDKRLSGKLLVATWFAGRIHTGVALGAKKEVV